MSSNAVLFSRDGLSQFSAIKVQVAVRGDSTNPDFKGIQAAGKWWSIDEPTQEVIEGDEGATGLLVVDPETNKVKQVYTLKQKMEQLFTLEGRRKEEGGRWSDPEFPLENVSGNQNQAPPPKARRLVTLKILDKKGIDGVWESAKGAGVSAAELGKGQSGQNAAASQQQKK